MNRFFEIHLMPNACCLMPEFEMIAGSRATEACEPRQVRKEAAAAMTHVCCGEAWLSAIDPWNP
jgi:hypothetical protein